jgi:MFS family permease
MLSLLRQRNVALLWFSGLISLTGTWMLMIALPVHVYQLTGSTLATGAMFIAETLPSVALSSIAGVYVDRWDRRRTMIITNLLLAVAILPLLGVQTSAWLGVVYLVALVQSAISQFFSPAEHALLPQLVSKDELPAANTLNALNNNLARLIGPALGGLIAGSVGLGGVVLIDAATYLIAAGLVLAMRHIPEAARPATDESASTTSSTVWREWRAGLQLVLHQRVLRILFVIVALTALGEGIMSVLFVPFVTEALGGAALQIGWLMSAQAIGGLIGTALIGPVAQRISPERLLGPSSILFGLIDLAMFVYPAFVQTFTPALVLIILVGIPAVGFGTSFHTLLQTNVADRYRGRIFGAYTMTASVITLAGMGAASVLGEMIGIVVVISVQGIVYIIAGLIALMLPRMSDMHSGARDSEIALSQEAM